MGVSHLEFLVEERSIGEALKVLLPQLVGDVSYKVRTFDGKPDLLKKLPQRLAGYRHWPREHMPGIVVVVDKDKDDCVTLVSSLETTVQEAGFVCASVTGQTPGSVLNRLAIEELAAWFFGDVPALVSAYPRVPATLGERAAYRDPDAIKGGTWQALERVLQEAGHHLGGPAKGRAAREIATHMNVEANRSRSFQKFRDGVRLLVQGDADAQA